MTVMGHRDMAAVLHINTPCELFLGSEFYQDLFSLPLQARFLLSKVNPSQTHNNMYAWGQVSAVYLPNTSTFPMWGILIRLVWRAIVIQQYKHVSACSNIVLPTPLLIESHFLCLCRNLAHPFWQMTWVFRCLWIIWKSWQCPALPKSFNLFLSQQGHIGTALSFPPFISCMYWAKERSSQSWREVSSLND